MAFWKYTSVSKQPSEAGMKMNNEMKTFEIFDINAKKSKSYTQHLLVLRNTASKLFLANEIAWLLSTFISLESILEIYSGLVTSIRSWYKNKKWNANMCKTFYHVPLADRCIPYHQHNILTVGNKILKNIKIKKLYLDILVLCNNNNNNNNNIIMIILAQTPEIQQGLERFLSCAARKPQQT